MVPLAAHIALLAAIAGCYRPSLTTGAPCQSNVDCPLEQLCDLGASPPSCNTQLSDAAPPSTPRLVQQATAGATAGQPSMTLPSPPIAGNVLVVAAGAGQAPLTGVSGGGVTLWSRATASVVFCNEEIWYGTSDGSSPTVTLLLPDNKDAIFGSVTEWSGLAGATMPDAATSTSQRSSPATAGSITTHHTGDLLVFAASTGAPVTWDTASPGEWTALEPVDGGSDACEQAAWYRVVTTTGSYAPSVNESGASPWDAAVAAFVAAP